MNRPLPLIILSALLILTSVWLYQTCYRVQDMDQELKAVRASIAVERAHIRVLKAEWAYLAAPARLEGAARRHLAMRPTTAAQIADSSRLKAQLPTVAEATQARPAPSSPVKVARAPLPKNPGRSWSLANATPEAPYQMATIGLRP